MLKKLLILIAIPFLMCSCTATKNVEEITFSSWGSVTEVKILSQVIKNFEAENPEIRVNFIHIPQNYFQKIHLLFASNLAPDVIFVNNLYLPIYANKLLPLDKVITKSDFYPESLKAMSIDGKLLAVPRDISTLAFYRNKNLISQTPRNLNELLEVVKNVKPFGISYERDMYFMLPYILTFKEDIYFPQKSLAYYKNLEGHYAPAPSQVGSSTLAQMFLDGKIGLYLSGRWMYPKISEKANFDWDVITFPGTVPLDASGWAVSKATKHKEAAEKFVKYLSSKKNIEFFNSTGLIVPARKDVEVDNVVFVDAIKKSQVIKTNRDYKKITDKMNRELLN